MLNVSGFPLYSRLNAATLASEKASFAKRPAVTLDIAYFREKAATIKTPEEFTKNFRLMKFALDAYGLGSQISYTARNKQILLSDRSDQRSLVNRMTDPTYREINAAFDFTNSGVSKLTDSKFLDQIAQKYSETKYEEDLGTMNPNLPTALYFERKIKSVKSGYEIIGDTQLFDVIKTVLNIPNSAVVGSVERVKAWIEKGFDLARVSDPKYIKNIVERYLVLKDVKANESTSNPLLDLFA